VPLAGNIAVGIKIANSKTISSFPHKRYAYRGFSTNLTHFFSLFSMYLFFHLYTFQTTSAHHQEGTIVSTHPLVYHTGKVTGRRAGQHAS
jgi:hypothetical protein